MIPCGLLPVLEPADPAAQSTEPGIGAVGVLSVIGNDRSPASTRLQAEGHRPKSPPTSMPLWCGLVTRLIKLGSEEYKSAKCQKAQDDERLMLEGQNVWDPDS
eukprot:7922178-Heterocapsa_arctica.AAC.1